MSQNYHGRDMDRPSLVPGSVRRARERMQAGVAQDTLPFRQQRQTEQGYPDADFGGGPFRLADPPSRRAKDVSAMDTPQWPLPGPTIPASRPGPRSNQPPLAPSQPGPRAADASAMSDLPPLQPPIPFFVARSSVPGSPQEVTEIYNATSPAESSSRRTTSSVGSIPDFPIPGANTLPPPPRRSAILGPPPSSRRGMSSMYSTSSFVSPIPEESPRSRSHGSYASSAAMPETWGTSSPMLSPGDSEDFFDDSVSESERSRDSTLEEDFGDEAQLVRSASLGKKGKAALVTTGSAPEAEPSSRPVPTSKPLQPFEDGTGYVDPSTTSMARSTMSIVSPAAIHQSEGLTPDAILRAYAAASLSDPAESRAMASSPRLASRLSNLRRPPKLDIDAVRAAEERGSLTSLPDLIRRATRLASLIDKGKRPGSRLDDLNGFGTEKGGSRDGDGSLSDMLAAFPPPVQTPRNNSQSRSSVTQSGSWPTRSGADPGSQSRSLGTPSEDEGRNQKKGRRCCGLPLWAVVIIVILLICIIVAAVVVPLEFFVFRNLGGNRNRGPAEASLENCRKAVTCLNGGINVLSPGSCSCICTNGFTGSDCSIGGAQGCTTTNLVEADGSNSIDNVTLGGAIPRLIAEADANYSVPLSGTVVLGKLNAGNLSCIAQNSLVTFDGRAMRGGRQQNAGALNDEVAANVIIEFPGPEFFPVISTIRIIPVPTYTYSRKTKTKTTSSTTTSTSTTLFTPPATTTSQTSTQTTTTTSRRTTTSTRTTAAPTQPPGTTPAPTPPGNLFVPTDDVVDFSRVAVLFVAQEQNVDAAETAQTALRSFFSKAQSNGTPSGAQGQVTLQEAANVSLGGPNRVNLVDFTVDVGRGPVGKKNS